MSGDFSSELAHTAENAPEIQIDRQAVLEERVPARWARPVQDAENTQTDGSIAVSYQIADQSFAQSSGEYSFVSIPAPLPAAKKPETEGGRVECFLCPQHCVIAPGRMGRCSARINRGGRLVSRFYGRPASIAVDPIEKKPLYHFLPTSRILSLGTFGCNLTCRFCQNWQLSGSLPAGQSVNRIMTPNEVVETALKHGCPSVAFTYNEPTIWAEYALDTARACRKAGLRTVLVTNGMIEGRAREELYDAVDAANVDLKAFSTEFYRNIAGSSLDAVKSTLLHIAKKTRVWLEITTLLIPTQNDSETEIKALCEWIAGEIGPDSVLHFSAFFPAHRMTHLPPTPPEALVRAWEIARDAGLKFVYVGNVDDDLRQSTLCPKCGARLIERSRRFEAKVLSALKVAPEGSAYCGICGERAPGVFGT